MSTDPHTQPMRNKRRARRKRAEYASEAIDVVSERVLGHVGDLSVSGLMLIGNYVPEPGAIHQLRLPLRGVDTPPQHIEVGVQALWHRAGADPARTWVGYRIIAISDRDGRMLRDWINAPG